MLYNVLACNVFYSMTHVHTVEKENTDFIAKELFYGDKRNVQPENKMISITDYLDILTGLLKIKYFEALVPPFVFLSVGLVCFT